MYSFAKRLYFSISSNSLIKENSLAIFHLQGSTGNQLFCLFAGLSYEIYSGKKVFFDESYLQPTQLRNPGGILDVEVLFNGDIFTINLRKITSPKIRTYFDRFFHKISQKLGKFSGQHRSKVYGYDSDFDLNARYKRIIGFFQTYIYVDQVTKSLGNLEIRVKEPTEWFENYSKKLSGLEKTVSIHIRRGDYAQNSQGIGMLDIEYFYSSLRYLKDLQEVDRAYIFSDGVIELNDFKERFPDVEFTFVTPPIESAPVESIILMSLTTFRLISNSSYSWWSAYLAMSPNSNFAPDPWFKNKEIPKKLIPDSWTKLDSIWTGGQEV